MIKINIEETEVEVTQVIGSKNEKAINITDLRNKTGYVTYDPGLGNTAITKSSITFLDGEKGILQYRGIDVFNLVTEKSYLEVAYLLFKGTFPSVKELTMMKTLIFAHSNVDKYVQRFFQNYSYLSTMNLLSIGITLIKEPTDIDDFERFCFYLAKHKVLCSYLFDPQHTRISFSEDYCEDFAYLSLNKKDNSITKILNALLIIHADHEQNCSTTSLRVIASSKASLKNALSGALLALSVTY
jgi:citrate synthase